MTKEEANAIAKQVFARSGNPATKILRAMRYAREMDSDEAGFDVVMDGVVLAASWRGKRVVVEDIEWTPPLIPAEGDIQ